MNHYIISIAANIYSIQIVAMYNIFMLMHACTYIIVNVHDIQIMVHALVHFKISLSL